MESRRPLSEETVGALIRKEDWSALLDCLASQDGRDFLQRRLHFRQNDSCISLFGLLHRYNAPMSVLHSILLGIPEGPVEKWHFEHDPLEYILWHKPKDNNDEDGFAEMQITLVRLVLQRFPTDYRMWNWKRNPLGIAAEYATSLRILQVVHEFGNHLVRTVDYKHPPCANRLPIHWAAHNSNPVAPIVVQQLLEWFPEGAQKKDAQDYYPLHAAAAFSDFSATIPILHEAFPAAATTRLPKTQDTPLHLVCSRNANPSMVEEVLLLNPFAVRATNKLDRLPFDLLCSHSSSVAALNVLVSAIAVKGSDGSTALHYACQRKFPDVNVLERLLELDPQSLTVADSHGRLPLHCAAHCSDSPDAIRYLARKGDSSALHHRDNDQNTVLHLACARNEPCAEIIRTLMDLFPEAVVARGGARAGMPLHSLILHCKKIYSDKNMEMILDMHRANPETALALDKYLRSPLHQIAIRTSILARDSVSDELLWKLTSPFMGAVQLQDRDGRTPFQVAIHLLANEQVTLQMLMADPSAAKREDPKNRLLPLFEVMERGGGRYGHRLIVALLEAYPDAAAMPIMGPGKNSLPLHYALVKNFRLELIQKLVEAYPAALLMEDARGLNAASLLFANNPPLQTMEWFVTHLENNVNEMERQMQAAATSGAVTSMRQYLAQIPNKADGNTALHLVSQRNRENTLHVVEKLLRLCPDALTMFNNDGMLPCHVSLVSKAPLEVTHLMVRTCPEAIFVTPHSRRCRCALEATLQMGATRAPFPDLLHMAYPHGISNVRNRDGEHPLHVLCAQNAASWNIIDKVREFHPKALQIADALGRLPLHTACESHSNYETFQGLIHGHDFALLQADKKGQLPFVSCAMNGGSHDVLFLLLRSCPEALRSTP